MMRYLFVLLAFAMTGSAALKHAGLPVGRGRSYNLTVSSTQPDFLIPTKGPNFGDTSNFTSYATASFTARSNAMVVAAVVASGTAGSITANPPGTGMGLTWTLQAQTNFNTLASPTETLCVYTAMTGTTNATGIFKSDFSPNTMSGACVHMEEFWNASNALVQIVSTASNATANPRIALSACAKPGTNAFFMALADNISSGVDNAPDSVMKWSEIWETNYATPATGLATYYSLAALPNMAGVTNTATSRAWAMIAMEIQPNIVVAPTYPSSGDLFVDFENSTDGTKVTTTIATNATHPSGSFSGQMWQTLSNNGTLFVSTVKNKNLPHTITVNGTTYDDSTSTRSWKLNNTNNHEYLQFNLPSNQTNVMVGFFWRFASTNAGQGGPSGPTPTNWFNDFNNYDFTTIRCVGGENEVMLLVNNATPQIRTETGVETSGSSETAFPAPIMDNWYWVCLWFDKSRLISRMFIFDANGAQPWPQYGYSDAIIASDDVNLFAIGRFDQHGTSSANACAFIDGFVGKWGNIQATATANGFPFVP